MSIGRIRSVFYLWARVLGDVGAVLALFRGDTGKAANRVKNKFVGRAIGRSGIWRKWK